MMAPHVHRLNI